MLFIRMQKEVDKIKNNNYYSNINNFHINNFHINYFHINNFHIAHEPYVIILGAIFIVINSWNINLHAYGSST